MAGPIITFRDEAGAPITVWSIGQIDAGQESAHKTVCIWNNYQGVADVAHAQDVKITTSDDFGDTTDVVKNKWIYVKNISAGESVFTQVGAETKKPLKAKEAAEGVIEGIANDGVLATSLKNHAKVELYLQSDLHGIAAGARALKIKTEYFYV